MSNQSRPSKRPRQHCPDPRAEPRVYRNRIPLEDDFEVVQARTSSLVGQGRLPKDSTRSDLRGKTTWTVGSSWAPEDDPELSLDPNDEWFNEAIEADVGDIIDGSTPPKLTSAKQKVKRSLASVRYLTHFRC